MKQLPLVRVYIILSGCFCLILGWVLPWYTTTSPFEQPRAISGLNMWLSHRTTVLAYAPQFLPELVNYLWLLPLATLLIGALSISEIFWRRWPDQWFSRGSSIALMILMGVFFWFAMSSSQPPQIGLWVCLLGWGLLFFAILSGFLSRIPGNPNNQAFSSEPSARRQVLRGLLGVVSFASISTSGFLIWRSWRTHTSLVVYRYQDPVTGRVLTGEQPDFNNILSVNWSSDGRRILVGQLHAPPQSWDALTGEQRRTYQPVDATTGTWSPDGQHLALANLLSNDSGRVPTIVNAITGVKEAEAAFNTSSSQFLVEAMAWFPDSQSIAVGGGVLGLEVLTSTIQVWRPFANKISQIYPLGPLSGRGRIGSLIWSPDGRYLAASTSQLGVFIWHVQSRMLLLQHATVQDDTHMYHLVPGRFLS